MLRYLTALLPPGCEGPASMDGANRADGLPGADGTDGVIGEDDITTGIISGPAAEFQRRPSRGRAA